MNISNNSAQGLNNVYLAFMGEVKVGSFTATTASGMVGSTGAQFIYPVIYNLKTGQNVVDAGTHAEMGHYPGDVSALDLKVSGVSTHQITWIHIHDSTLDCGNVGAANPYINCSEVKFTNVAITNTSGGTSSRITNAAYSTYFAGAVEFYNCTIDKFRHEITGATDSWAYYYNCTFQNNTKDINEGTTILPAGEIKLVNCTHSSGDTTYWGHIGSGADQSDGKVVDIRANKEAGRNRIRTFEYAAYTQDTTVHTAGSRCWYIQWWQKPYIKKRGIKFPLAKVSLAANKSTTISVWVRMVDAESVSTISLVTDTSAIVNSGTGTTYSDESTTWSTWEQLSITFTPPNAGILDVYLALTGGINTTTAVLATYADDFSVVQA